MNLNRTAVLPSVGKNREASAKKVVIIARPKFKSHAKQIIYHPLLITLHCRKSILKQKANIIARRSVNRNYHYITDGGSLLRISVCSRIQFETITYSQSEVKVASNGYAYVLTCFLSLIHYICGPLSVKSACWLFFVFLFPF